jgi:hypothetical protein
MLDRYWPTQEEIDRCIKAEAEAASEAVLLAVHQPMPLAVRNAGSQLERPATERKLLEYFLTDDLPEGTLLLAITGASGAGKSHLIRWLNAQLRRDRRAKRMLVVRIPKSASLRSVVDLILEPLAGDQRYEKARIELQQAMAEVTPEVGAIRLVGGLEIALNELGARLTTELRMDPQAPNRRDLMARLDHARRLPAFFNDAALQEHFKPNVLARIVERAIRGNDRPLEDLPLPQFAAEDLRVPGHVDLGQASFQVRQYYQTVLNRDGGKGFEQAADVLNEALDPAIREVFRLGQAMGGMTLEDIILHIRQILFEDGRELVLLVEDFAALSGIQEVLLRVCIQEAVRDGKLVRAPMRTALAVTDGYLAGRDTILTRAKREWILKTALDTEDDVIDRTRALVAAYLNAARWGEAALERRFMGSSQDGHGDLTAWVTTFSDENLSADEATVLDSFGKGPRDAPLFPYNDAAIRSLARRHLLEGGRLQFRPRWIINYVLRDVLIHRSDFKRGTFPPPEFEDGRPTADVANWLSRAVPAEETRGRLASLLVHWGANPANGDEVGGLPEGLFRAFNLPTPRNLGVANVPPSPPPGSEASGPDESSRPGPDTQAEPPDPELARWRDRLEAWVAGTRLGQQDANLLRKVIQSVLSEAINWNGLRVGTSAVQSSLHIEIPNAAGSGAAAMVRLPIAEDHRDSDGSLRRTLLAFVRYHRNGRIWSYPEGDEDSALVANLIDGLAEAYVRTVEGQVEAEIACIGRLLIRQARVLGLSTHGLGGPRGLAESVLAPAVPVVWADLPENSPEARWQELQREAHDIRPRLQDMLISRIGCFQGTGGTAYAIDVVRLSEATRREDAIQPRDLEQEPLRSHGNALGDIRLKVRLSPVVQNLKAFAGEMHEALGESFDKETYVREARALLDVLEKAGAWPGTMFAKKEIEGEIESFRNTALKDLLSKIRPLGAFEDSRSLDEVLAAVGKVDLSVVNRARRFLNGMNAFLNAAEETVATRQQAASGVDPMTKAEELDGTLLAATDHLSRLHHPQEVEA